MKLWVDDIRKEPDGWVRARSVTEAIRILDTMPVTEVSIDHDISMKVTVGAEEFGYSEPRPFRSNETFEPVVRYLAMNAGLRGHYWGLRVTIHSANVPAGERLAEILFAVGGFQVLVQPLAPCNRFEQEG